MADSRHCDFRSPSGWALAVLSGNAVSQPLSETAQFHVADDTLGTQDSPPHSLRPGSSINRMAHWNNAFALSLLLAAGAAIAQQQVNDPDFSPRVESPAISKKHRRIAIDEAHRNFHTRDGRYKPFAALMESDGFEVSAACNGPQKLDTKTAFS